MMNTNGRIKVASALHELHAVNLGQLNARLGVDVLSGTGFPNSVVSAPVGTIYVDTAVSNGASSWIKKSGTGNTGWVVLEGDTGWRNLTSLVNPGVAGVAILRARRIGNNVQWRTSIAPLTNTEIVPASSLGGFLTEESFSFYVFNSLTATQRGVILIHPTYGFKSNHTGGGNQFGHFISPTTQPWPTVLPGTPA